MSESIIIWIVIILFILLGYIIYLHFQLSKKNSFIKTFVDQVLKDNSKLDQQELLKLIKDFKISDYSTLIERDVILRDDIWNYIFEDEKNNHIFVHYTMEEDVAKNILKEGFRFVYSFYKTAELVFNDKLDMIYKHNRHRQFGPYVIVISISKDVYSSYASKLNQNNIPNPVVEQIITEINPVENENKEEVFTLPSQFIKGYFNYFTGEIIKNTTANSKYDSEKFEGNLKKLLIKKQ